MIIRVVTMSFEEKNIPGFLEVFEKYKSRIRGTKGCSHLSLIQNMDNPSEISTLSHWNSTSELNNYRKSDTFLEVWPLTKVLFNRRPIAISYTILTTG